MAAVTLLGSSFNTGTGAKTVTATPAVGDLIVIAIAHTGDFSWSSPTDNNSSGTYTLIGSILTDFTSAVGIYVRTSLIAAASSTIFTAPNPGSDTGGGLTVLKVTGMTATGSSAVRQSKATLTTTGSTGTWTNAKLTGNAIIGVLVDTLGATVGPTTGYTELYDQTMNPPYLKFQVQSIDSGDTTSTMDWTGSAATSMTGGVIGIELTVPTIVTLDAAAFGFTAQDVTQTRSLTLSAAALTFVANAPQLTLTPCLQLGSLDFSRQVFQIGMVNNLSAATFDFVQQSISAAQGATLSAAAMDYVGDTISFARTANLDVGALNLTGEPTEQIISTTLSAAAMDFVGVDVLPTRGITLDSGTFDFVAQSFSVAAAVTLAEATMDFDVLDITAGNAPLGTVVDLTLGSFAFTVNNVLNNSSTTLTTPEITYVSSEVQLASNIGLAVGTFDLVPQSLTVVQAPREILLDVVEFNLVARTLQLAGVSAAGDRKRMLLGVGR